MESSIAEFLMRQSACELLPTVCRTCASLPTSSLFTPVFTFKDGADSPQALPRTCGACSERCTSMIIYHSVHFKTHQSFAFY
jgi:hypothetical protein